MNNSEFKIKKVIDYVGGKYMFYMYRVSIDTSTQELEQTFIRQFADEKTALQHMEKLIDLEKKLNEENDSK